ncbi:MAG: glycosyl hydrolase family 65 protein [Actinomycetota bacterium]
MGTVVDDPDVPVRHRSKDGWTIDFDDAPEHRRVLEAILTIGDGELGTRGVSEVRPEPPHIPVTYLGSRYGREPPGRILTGPNWLDMPIRGRGIRWHLDLRRGIVGHDIETDDGRVDTVRFAVAHVPGVHALEVRGADVVDWSNREATVDAADGVAVAVTTGDHREELGDRSKALVRLVSTAAERDGDAATTAAEQLRTSARETGVRRLLREHARRWAERWEDAEVDIVGDPDSELGVRFAIYHLLSSVRHHGASAVGARGLTGPAYLGHVFWDADVFVLPALAAIDPAGARSMLDYRVGLLAQAHRNAAADGHLGARFPWESAASGIDVTPAEAIAPNGLVIPVRTGELELHIVADVAWAAVHLARWTGNRRRLLGPHRPLVVEAARFWASRVELDADGNGHLRDVIGPDEYHEGVDDNAFTNLMARWTLRTAAHLESIQPDGGAAESERRAWRRIADSIVDGYDPATGVHAQFDGFDELDPVTIGSIATPPVAADLLLGREVVQRSQIIKQPDVVMAHHLIGEDLPPGSMCRDLDRYLPHTSHGSSLSPAIHAAVLARAGRPDDALHLFRVAARLDLDDLTGTTAFGLHLATMGGLWQALAFGFLGLDHDGETALRVDPTLPHDWRSVRLRCRFHGVRIEIVAGHDEVVVEADEPVRITTPTDRATVAKRTTRLTGGAGRWRVRS